MTARLLAIALLAGLSGLFVGATPASAQENPIPQPRIQPIPGGGRAPLPPRPLPSREEAGDEEGGGASGAEGDEPSPPPPADERDSGKSSSGSSSTSGRDVSTPQGTDLDRQRPPASLKGSTKVQLDGKYTIERLVKYFADVMKMNFIIVDEKNLKDEVTIISNREVSAREAYEAFLQALEMSGYTTVTKGNTTQLIKTSEAAQSPLDVGQGSGVDDIRWTANYVTQIIPLENVSTSDINSVVSSLVGPGAKVIAYAPSNTMIITDTGHNLRKVAGIIAELDIAAPKSRMEITQLQWAEAAQVQSIIQELYGTADSSSSSAETAASRRRTRRSRRRRPRRDEPEPTQGESVTAGKASSYISKVLSDERTNSIIVLANEEGHQKVADLLKQIDVDVTLSSRSQIHVVYLEHAKAEDVAQVLSNLSEGGRSGSSSSRTSRARSSRTAVARRNPRAQAGAEGDSDAGSSGGAIAAFDSGMRITSDENTNSLVIIATPDDFKVVKSVIDKLDVRRRQVFVDAVILELASDDDLEMGVAYHAPYEGADGTAGLLGGQFNASSLGLSTDLLTGLAVGIMGQAVSVPFYDASTLTTANVDIPSFGIVLNFLKSNSGTNLVSNPNLLTLDNEEAKITVGRKVPFPTTSGLNNLGQPVVSYQREDVAVTLQITPRVNSTDYVTLEIVLEASEIEEDSQGLDVQTSGFITSKREVETVALVKDNQTVVIGGLIGTTDTQVETKVPILGDMPLIGPLFRGSRTSSRKSNLMIFLTPHIVDDEEDMLEIMRVKEAQRREFMRRFYGQSREKQLEELDSLLRYSMNHVDEPSMFRGPTTEPVRSVTVGDEPLSDESSEALEEALDEHEAEQEGELAIPVEVE